MHDNVDTGSHSTSNHPRPLSQHRRRMRELTGGGVDHSTSDTSKAVRWVGTGPCCAGFFFLLEVRTGGVESGRAKLAVARSPRLFQAFPPTAFSKQKAKTTHGQRLLQIVSVRADGPTPRPLSGSSRGGGAKHVKWCACVWPCIRHHPISSPLPHKSGQARGTTGPGSFKEHCLVFAGRELGALS